MWTGWNCAGYFGGATLQACPVSCLDGTPVCIWRRALAAAVAEPTAAAEATAWRCLCGRSDVP